MSFKYLRQDQLDLLHAAAAKRSTGQRDSLLILMSYRHGYRVREACNARWQQIDWQARTIHVERLKGSASSVQPIRDDELAALQAWHTAQVPASEYIFTTAEGRQLSTRMARHMMAEAGSEAGLGNVHPHMLRHSTGYLVVKDGLSTRALQAYLGHKNLAHTELYSALSDKPFEEFFKSAVSAQAG